MPGPSVPFRCLFLQDKQRYSREEAEKQQLLQYVKDYMDIDPKQLGDQEREELMAKAKVIMEQEKKRKEKGAEEDGATGPEEATGSSEGNA